MTPDTETPTVVESTHALRLAGKLAIDATFREHLAGQALCGLLASHAGVETSLPTRAEAAKMAVGYADKLIARLSDRTSN